MKEEKKERQTPGSEPAPRARRPYQPPAIRRQETFETVAMGCSKLDPDDCGVSWKTS